MSSDLEALSEARPIKLVPADAPDGFSSRCVDAGEAKRTVVHQVKGRGNRFIFQHLCLSKDLGVKNKAVLEIDINDVCLSTHGWHSRWSFVSMHSHAKRHWLPHSGETDNCFMNLFRYLSKIPRQLLIGRKVSRMWLCRSLNGSSCVCLSVEFHKESQRYYKRIML